MPYHDSHAGIEASLADLDLLDALTAPALPSSMPSTAFTIQAMNSAQDVQGLSIQQGADFFGFSIEMSVVTQVSEYHVVGDCVWLVRGMRDLTRDRLGLGLGYEPPF